MGWNGRVDRRVLHLAEPLRAGRRTSARTGAWSETPSKKIVHRNSFPPGIFFQGFLSHPSNDVALLREALFPSFFVGQRIEDLGRDCILLILRKYPDLLQGH